MAARTTPSIGAEADRLEAAINQAQLPIDQEIGVWSVYGDHGLAAALHVLTATKEAKSRMLMRQKAMATDDFDQLGQQFAAAGRARAMAAGADKVAVLKAMQAQIAQLNTVQPSARTLTDQGTSTLKETDPFAAAFQGDLRSDMVPR